MVSAANKVQACLVACMKGVVYQYNPKYFTRSVIDWLYKALTKKVGVDVYVKDVEHWDSVLWNRHTFLPHVFVRSTKYDRIRLLDREKLGQGCNSEVQQNCNNKVVVVFEPDEHAMCNVDGAVWFVGSSIDGSDKLVVYKQSESGQWAQVRS